MPKEPPKVLTMDDTILCGPDMGKLHGGTVVKSVKPTDAKLQVGNSDKVVLLATSLGPVTPGTCKTLPPPPSQQPCKSVTKITSGVATKLQVHGVGVLLDTLEGLTDGVPPGQLAVTAKQTKLTAI